MRKFVYILLAAIVLTGCGYNIKKSSNPAFDSSQKGHKIEHIQPAGIDTLSHLVGAFGEQREITSEEMAMFRKATADDSLVVYTPLSVSTQVVAGINYRFWCRFEDTSDGIQRKSADDSDKYGYCWITIYKPLPGQGEPRVTTRVSDVDSKKNANEVTDR